MATQFEKVMGRLDDIAQKLDLIAKRLEIISSPQDDLFGEDPFDDEDYGTADESGMEQEEMFMPKKPSPSATRTHVEVRDLEGGMEMVPWSDIDPRIIEAVRIASEMQQPWELYRDTTGMIRLSVSAEVAHRIRKSETYQQPVPRVGDREVDALGVDKEGE